MLLPCQFNCGKMPLTQISRQDDSELEGLDQAERSFSEVLIGLMETFIYAYKHMVFMHVSTPTCVLYVFVYMYVLFTNKWVLLDPRSVSRSPAAGLGSWDWAVSITWAFFFVGPHMGDRSILGPYQVPLLFGNSYIPCIYIIYI